MRHEGRRHTPQKFYFIIINCTNSTRVRTVVPTGTEEEHHARHVHVVPDGVGVSKIQPLCVVQYSFMFFIVSFNQKKYVQYGISMAETQRSSQSTVQYGYCRRTPYDMIGEGMIYI